MTLDQIAILGAGGMGTAMAVLLARSGLGVRLWARSPGFVDEVRRTRENARYLAGIPLPEPIDLTSDAGHATRGAGLILVAVPSAHLRATLRAIAPEVPPGTPAVSVVKGIERETFARPSRIIRDELGPRPVAILSGPSHAEEIARGLPTSVVVAGEDAGLNLLVRDALNTDRFRVYSNPDAIGVELGGALKNVIGVAAGVCDGLGFGDNAKAGLVTRGLAEMSRFGTSLGARPATFLGMAGVGDLITTCFSPFGRNRALGERIGRGETLAEIEASTPKVAEGVPTCRSVEAMARDLGIEMPITSALRRILFDGQPPLEAVSDLMERETKDEWP
ncbi:NAD(P)H-dependent glycerol-3-phosphate dehydrogenase [Tautonia plasticadhaerens]|uniref:Glycerol-3-phosphate dehydrogenase [NAD(P)+] n=1 Tax=Tautonia plasticadhaerens TaxID=2527974 RepID=A0A518H8T6_9BACT|nr:NAD(P)H-dependent glycerol-3-phosphate dehydrogenase [Tautonia plasticadhaerens]QDV37255.1 Glycerol-3-phosphate dehydrogenase [NAD(P)+] [Tautonia plasticadhaerens]